MHFFVAWLLSVAPVVCLGHHCFFVFSLLLTAVAFAHSAWNCCLCCVVEGFETARALALHGAHVILACRNMRSANRAVNAIKNENVAADVEAMFIDLTSLKTVQNFACSYISRNLYAFCHC